MNEAWLKMIISHSSPEKHVLINSRLWLVIWSDADTSHLQHGKAAAGGAATAVHSLTSTGIIFHVTHGQIIDRKSVV